MAIERILGLSDLQLRPEYEGVPTGEDTESLLAVKRYVKDHKWDRVVQIGDFVDLDCLSTHNHGKPKLVETRRLQKDYDHANRWLDEWQKATGSAKWTLLEGNHDYRAVAYGQAFPAMEGKVEVPVNLELKARGVQWVPYWSNGELYKTGNLYWGHGRSTIDHHCKKNVQDYGVCLLTGHTHTTQEYCTVRFGDDKTICAKSIGCLCRYNQPYMQGRPSKWQQAFEVVHVDTKTGYFNSFSVKLFGNHFISPEGDRY